MLYKKAFQSATALKLGGIVTFVFSSLFSIEPASAIPATLLTPRPPRPIVVSDYIPPQDQLQPPNHELTKPTSGRSDNHREPPAGTEGSVPDSENNLNPEQDSSKLEVLQPTLTVPTEVKNE